MGSKNIVCCPPLPRSGECYLERSGKIGFPDGSGLSGRLRKLSLHEVRRLVLGQLASEQVRYGFYCKFNGEYGL